MKKSPSRPRAFLYVPDHIRLCRSDRLWHIRDSHLLLFKRLLNAAWDNAAAYHTCQSLRHEIAVIDQELHRRWMKRSPSHRLSVNQEQTQRYLENQT